MAIRLQVAYGRASQLPIYVGETRQYWGIKFGPYNGGLYDSDAAGPPECENGRT